MIEGVEFLNVRHVFDQDIFYATIVFTTVYVLFIPVMRGVESIHVEHDCRNLVSIQQV